MDEHIGNSNKIITGSFYDNKYKMIQAKVADLNKKRKLESEQLFFPLSKQKFGYRSFSFEHEQPLIEKSDENDVIHSQTNNGKRVVELADESSFVGGSDSTMSWNAENENMLEAEDSAQSIISSSSCSSKSLKDTLHSLRRRIVTEPTIGKVDQVVVAGIEEPNHPNIKDQLQFGPGAQFPVDQLQQFEEHATRMCVPYQVDDDLENCFDEELSDILLYSNGPSETDRFVLSSGRWSIDKEAQQGPRRPTIDQEFEQYFSSLML
ncbi:protein FAR-RED-ELONGATED HYPOCOTYL 1-LIKE-like [Telopea speciosissima]|uniref:protein FAR-RED-ELONGATED HYPOCOTYL 1-LIKE-like n=1 Tax=Telopea speciosissima TaxID=54955 RepID=UPI001CC54AB9|nr:protein FAR-RED-ELONGATED HYPOCOTYL 1-LIKE-like [Telopea speciosissima]